MSFTAVLFLILLVLAIVGVIGWPWLWLPAAIIALQLLGWVFVLFVGWLDRRAALRRWGRS